MKFKNFDKKTLFSLFLITIIFLIFFKNEGLIKNILNLIDLYVKPFFEFENTWFSCITILFISILSIYLLIRYNLLVLLNNLLIYSILLFLNLLFFKSVCLDYFDLFVLISFKNIEINILSLILLIINLYYISIFLLFSEEKSLNDSKEHNKDQLLLGSKADDFFNLLQDRVDESIFGINGSWGVGKTFFYKIIKQKLIKSGIKEEQIIEINVWKCNLP
ncbi:P-loop NTPase fold protein [Empedobacter sedimenti]|uniref:P-loop NTPase fold protein n=1 Tax=Empedobacter sedimenti TaxID=3042610 RepID=UPI0024A72897|nr:P-loop NTPase fold protein [Empedobacter sedimenti]